MIYVIIRQTANASSQMQAGRQQQAQAEPLQAARSQAKSKKRNSVCICTLNVESSSSHKKRNKRKVEKKKQFPQTTKDHKAKRLMALKVEATTAAAVVMCLYVPHSMTDWLSDCLCLPAWRWQSVFLPN